MKIKRNIVFFILSLYFTPLFFFGEQINLSNTPNQSVWAAVAVNPAGEIMVVWSEWPSDGIYYRTQKDGQWSEMKKAGIVYQQSWSNQLAVDSFGTFHLSYADGYGSLGREIYYSYFTGSQWSDAEMIYDSPHNSAWNRIDVDTNDDIYIQWYHKYYNLADVSDIVSISKPRMGSWPSSYENVSRSLGKESIHPAFRVRNGNVFSSYMDDEGPRRIYFAERIGGIWRTPVEIESGYYPALEVDSSGNVHIVWSKFNGNFYYKSRDNGQWGVTEIISNGEAPLYFGDLKCLSNVVVANWVEDEGGTWGVYASAKIPGSQWITPVKIGETLPLSEDDERLVQVALDSSGCAHFVWHGIGQNGQTDIFYSKYCISGEDVKFIEVDKLSLNFTALRPNSPSPQTFKLRNAGNGNMDYTLSADMGWIDIQPISGSSDGEWDTITIGVDASIVEAGTHSGTISVSSSNAINSPQSITVNFKIYDSEDVSPPFGSFDTPVDGTTGITGAIPVTGWVLDDIGVESVKIFRDPIAGENAIDPVYIGDAVFVKGARTDVEQIYPMYPQSDQAGWGYMMLTNFLPGQGNGTYKIHAYATDLDGHTVSLGTKTIHCDNANAVKPFGAIDAPIQGGEASGSLFNSGWALTPMPNKIPEDGSTINVWVDGRKLGSPTYNQYRDDIVRLFPGYANTDGAVGAFYLDTTTYTNGVHTIAWSVVDDAGNSDGIGSRFFTIANTSGSAQAEIQSHREDLRPSLSYESILNMPVNFDPIKFKRGYKQETEPEIARTNEYGLAIIQIREVERTEVALGNGVVTGYMIVGEELRPLPIGSTLDNHNGLFCWQPGPGFIGEYDFVFIKTDELGMQRRMNVKINIRPKFSIYRKDVFKNSQARGKVAD